MAYIGVSPSNGVRRKHTYTATANQTSFSGAGAEGATLSYNDSNFVDVYQNGVKLSEADYTSTSGTAIVLAQGASVSDIVEVVVYDVFSVADTVSKSAGGTFDNAVTITTADNNAQLILTSTDADAAVGPVLEFNRNSASAADSDLLGRLSFIGKNDAGEDVDYGIIRYKIDDASDGTEDADIAIRRMVAGTSTNVLNFKTSETIFNEDSADLDFRVESNGNANMLFVDGGNNHVNIGSSSDAGGVLNVSDGTSFSIGITVENTGDTHGSVIDFLNNSDSPADGDYIGGLIFKETNSAGGTHQFAKIFGIALDITDGTEDGAITFETSAGGANTLEHMRITNVGDVLFQKTSATTAGAGTFFNVPSAPSTMPVYLRFCKTYSGVREGISFAHNNSQVGGILFDNSSTTFSTSSDYRLKENVVTDWDATTRLKKLKPSRFNFIADADTTVDGFLAHEVSSIVPEAISGEKDATEDITNVVLNADDTVLTQDISKADWEKGKLATTDKDGNTVDPIYASDTTWVASKTIPVMQGIDQSKIVPLLVKTIQELEARITALENA